jgi:hypothetical protein
MGRHLWCFLLSLRFTGEGGREFRSDHAPPRGRDSRHRNPKKSTLTSGSPLVEEVRVHSGAFWLEGMLMPIPDGFKSLQTPVPQT